MVEMINRWPVETGFLTSSFNIVNWKYNNCRVDLKNQKPKSQDGK